MSSGEFGQTDSLVDGLARTLARPIPRRRALRLMGLSALVAAAPAFRPALARAQLVECGHERYICGFRPGAPYVCCGDGPDGGCCLSPQKCCLGGKPHCCGEKATCRDWDDPQYPRGCQDPCLSDEETCGPSGLCCSPDQVCEHSRGICCPIDEDAPECTRPEAGCAKKVEHDYDVYVKSSCAGPNRTSESLALELTHAPSRGGREPGNSESFYSLGCNIFAYAVLRRGRLEDCPKTYDDSVCQSGGRCDPKTGRCRQPDCGQISSRPSVPVDESSMDHDDDRTAASAAARDPGRKEIIRTLKRGRPRLVRAAERLWRAYEDPAAEGSTRPSPELVAALVAYRRDIRSLRRSVARIKPRSARGRKARVLVLKSLERAEGGLEWSRLAAVAPTLSSARSHVKYAKISFGVGSDAASQARRALGCARGC